MYVVKKTNNIIIFCWALNLPTTTREIYNRFPLIMYSYKMKMDFTSSMYIKKISYFIMYTHSYGISYKLSILNELYLLKYRSKIFEAIHTEYANTTVLAFMFISISQRLRIHIWRQRNKLFILWAKNWNGNVPNMQYQ